MINIYDLLLQHSYSVIHLFPGSTRVVCINLSLSVLHYDNRHCQSTFLKIEDILDKHFLFVLYHRLGQTISLLESVVTQTCLYHLLPFHCLHFPPFTTCNQCRITTHTARGTFILLAGHRLKGTNGKLTGSY